jgi:diamine N-acetyltransferase
MISLVEINRKNIWDIINLKAGGYIEENGNSIAQSKVQPECIPLAIYNDDIPVGFLMYCIDIDDGNYWIYRFMIGIGFQRKGYGKKAMELLINEIKKDDTHNKILLDVDKKNDRAVLFYKNCEFKIYEEDDSNYYMMLEY